MQQLYLVHPTYWLRFCFWWASSFVSDSFWPKLVYVDSIHAALAAAGHPFTLEQLQLPPYVMEYDAYWNGGGGGGGAESAGAGSGSTGSGS